MISYILIYPACSKPIFYTLGSIDRRFGLSNEKILEELVEAEGVWEKFRKSNLFEYVKNAKDADITIDFIYDIRQQELVSKQSLNANIDDYIIAFRAYENRVIAHNAKLAQYEERAKQYDDAFKMYDNAVSLWNNSSRTDESELSRLENEEIRLRSFLKSLKIESASVEQSEKSLNYEKDQIDKRKAEIEKIYGELSIPVNTEVEQGSWNSETKKVVIYRFQDNRELKWLLAHELGHVLGMEHVEYPRSVMHYLISSSPILSLSNDDVRELSRVCMDY